jgi:YVTN family beta-propeller protein
MKIKSKKKLITVITLAALTFSSSVAFAKYAYPTYTVGQQTDGSVVATTDQVLIPAGQQVQIGGVRPNAVALNPDGKTAAFLTSGSDFVTVVDLVTGTKKQTLKISDGRSGGPPSGITYSKDGRKLFASDTSGKIMIADVNADGTLTLNSLAILPKSSTSPSYAGPWPVGLALSDDGKTLYVALSGNNTLGIFDIATQKLVDEIPVGNAPYGVVVVGNKAYVSNEGGRPATAGDFTNKSDGTDIVADKQSGAASTGTVSVVDLDTHKTLQSITVGLHPTGMYLHDHYLFVANTNSDSISVIDTTSNNMVKTINIQPFPDAPFGSTPTGLTMTGDGKLVVSLGTNNALGVYKWQPNQPVSFEGLIPTGWYPADVTVDKQQRLIVANLKGIGSLGDGNAKAKMAYSQLGTVSIIPVPKPEDIQNYTKQVFKNNNWNHVNKGDNGQNQDNNGQNHQPVSIPQHIGDPSLIKHVFFIIKENRTYDQVLGDDTRGNGAPDLVQFGKQVTPNEHALATQFPLLDNFYASGIASDEGHQWLNEAYVSSYLEKMEYSGPERGYPYYGGDSLAYSPTGFIWENATKHGRTVRNYGEYANQFSGPQNINWADSKTWFNWYNDSQILEGKKSGSLNAPIGTYQATSDVPSNNWLLNHDYPAFTSVSIPDQYRADIFQREFAGYVKNGNLPNLVMMSLPQDHTGGTSPGFPTPQAQVADNDLALGRIVDTISHSPYWKDSAIFVVEDDAQSGTDHVDGHRTTGFVISPYAKRNIVDSTYYTHIDMVRTIEQILGLPPMNQMDWAARPMNEVFTNRADLTPYNVLQNNIPLDEINPQPTAMNSTVQAWAVASAQSIKSQDELDKHPNVLNHANWYATKGFTTPYPGDIKILLPNEVQETVVSNNNGKAND